jgi:hypothetical protein
MLRGQRRASIVGSARCAKTMLAREKSIRQGKVRHTLVVCFNQPLARTLADVARRVSSQYAETVGLRGISKVLQSD